MKLEKEEVTLNSPLYMGFFILEESKYLINDLYHNKLKPVYGKQISLAYMDTDSFLLKFDDIYVYDHIQNGPLSSIIETSKFPKEHPLHSDDRKSVLGLIRDSGMFFL